MGLIAVVENLDDLGDETLPALAGCNITGVVTEDEHDDMVRWNFIEFFS